MQHFITMLDLGTEGLEEVLNRADALKRLRGLPNHPLPLAGKTIAVLMEKASTRTRISFVVGIHELGGLPIYTSARDLQLGRGEPIEDTARILSRYVHGIVYRTGGHDRIEKLAGAASVPVFNGLTDKHHPCQVLADLMTIRENTGGRLKGLKVAWVGDGNNMAHSWILSAALADFELQVACPEGYAPANDVIEQARALGRGRVVVTQDIEAATEAAHVVTTDVWASMGQEGEAGTRRAAFERYRVTDALMKRADPHAIFLHCLPAHRGEEVEASVIDGPASRVWDEAENRLHVQKALLERFIWSGGHPAAQGR
jgi:ornithine carbamoyltransferase